MAEDWDLGAEAGEGLGECEFVEGEDLEGLGGLTWWWGDAAAVGRSVLGFVARGTCFGIKTTPFWRAQQHPCVREGESFIIYYMGEREYDSIPKCSMKHSRALPHNLITRKSSKLLMEQVAVLSWYHCRQYQLGSSTHLG